MADLFHRVSIRKYQDRPVEREKLLEILRAGMQAPSAVNQQPWEFYVVTNPEKLKELGAVSPYAGPAAKAPACIVSVTRKECLVPEMAEGDMAIAMENIWLMTDELGLGGVWLGVAPFEERMQAVERILELPDSVRAFGLFALGYPAEERTQQNRFDESRIHWVE